MPACLAGPAFPGRWLAHFFFVRNIQFICATIFFSLNETEIHFRSSVKKPTSMVDTVQLTKTYFDTWNKHDVSGIQTLHAASSKLKVAHEFLWPLHLVG